MVIKESIIDSEKFFNFEGLDYQKDQFIITYGNIQLDSNKDIIKEDVTVGLRHKRDFTIVLSSNKPVSEWSDGTTNFSDLDTLIGHIGVLISFSNGGGLGNGIVISQQVDTFDDLVAGQVLGELAYVENSQGTAWNPFSTYKPAGWYVWDGLVWNSDRNAIANQLEQNILAISANDGDILQLQSDLAQEVLDRIAGDSVLQSQITLNDNEIAQLIIDLGAEITARINGDALLQGQITLNDANILQLQNDLAQEVLDRIAGDTAIDNDLQQLKTELPLYISNNSGQIKLNWDLANEPRSVSGFTANTPNQVPLNSNYTVSGSPTTTYPYLANAGIGGQNVVNPITFLLRELKAGQTIIFRVKCGYFNKGSGQNGNFKITMYNPNPASSFTVPKSIPTPDGTTTVEEEFEYIAIADSLSLDPNYGYAFEAESTFNDGNLTAFISEITAFYVPTELFNK